MGSWGVKALESDNGLDLISLLKTDYLPKHKKLTLGGLIGFLKEEGFLGETVSEIDFLYDNTAIALAELYSEWRETGKLNYYEILTKQFIHRFNSTEKELLDELNMERSVFYDRKREALFLFSVCLFGYAVPKLQEELDAPRLFPD